MGWSGISRAQPSGGFLSKIGGEDPWIVLERGSDETRSMAALKDIVATRAREAGKRLLQMVIRGGHASGQVRAAMALSLGRLGHRPAVPYLWRMLRSDSLLLRAAALEGLAMVLGDQITSLLIRALRRPALADAAQRALIRLGPGVRLQVERLLLEPRSVAGRAARVLSAWGDPRAVPSLIGAFKNGNLSPTEVLPLLGRFRDPRVKKLLLRLLASSVGTTRSEALRVLRLPLDASSAPALMAALGRGGVDTVRAVRLLARTGSADALTVLLSYVNHTDPRLREAALESLGMLRTKAAVAALTRMLKPRYRKVYFAALRGLSLSGRREAVASLLRHTRWSGRVGVAAIHALGTLLRRRAEMVLGSRSDRASALHRAVVHLRLLASGKDDRARASVLALGRIAVREDLDLLLRLFRKSDVRLRRLACRGFAFQSGRESMVELMEKAVQNGRDGRVASCAARVLGDVGATRSIPLLAKALKGGKTNVACNASASLVRLGGRRAAAALRGALRLTDSCARANAALAMGVLGVRAATGRLRRLSVMDHDPIVRMNAARSLRRILGAAAVPFLSDRLTVESNPRARRLFGDLLGSAGGRQAGLKPGKDFVAFWVLGGTKKKKPAWKTYRLVHPSGLVVRGFADEFGFGVEDGLSTGTADLQLD
jgi:HEAT repeat protein